MERILVTGGGGFIGSNNSLTLIKEKLKWRPKVSLEEDLTKTCE